MEALGVIDVKSYNYERYIDMSNVKYVKSYVMRNNSTYHLNHISFLIRGNTSHCNDATIAM